MAWFASTYVEGNISKPLQRIGAALQKVAEGIEVRGPTFGDAEID